MKKASADKGYLLCFCLNLCYNFGWVILAAFLWGMNVWKGVPSYFIFGALGIWVLESLISTVMVAWASKSANQPIIKKENKNPYSAKNEDMLKNDSNEEKE